SRKGALDVLRIGQLAHRLVARGAHTDPAKAPLPLHVVQRGQNLIVRDHSAADDRDFRSHATAACSPIASANASPNTFTLSSIASAVITSGGEIFTVPLPSPTGLNISSPFSIERRTTSNARSPSG